MFDAKLRRFIDRGLNLAGRWLAGLGISANHVTIAGAGFGLLAFIFIAADLAFIGLWMIILNRVADGVDGAVARPLARLILAVILIWLWILYFIARFLWHLPLLIQTMR